MYYYIITLLYIVIIIRYAKENTRAMEINDHSSSVESTNLSNQSGNTNTNTNTNIYNNDTYTNTKTKCGYESGRRVSNGNPIYEHRLDASIQPLRCFLDCNTNSNSNSNTNTNTHTNTNTDTNRAYH
jgi:hypothetical protein